VVRVIFNSYRKEQKMNPLKIFKSLTVLSILLVLSGGAFAEVYKVDTQKSHVSWLGKKVIGQHNGTIQIHKGSVIIDDQIFTGHFIIDMKTIVNLDLADAAYNKKLVGHLNSKDFFSVEKYPTAKFEIIKAIPYTGKDKKDANYMVYGKLTIKGITHEIFFPALIEKNKTGFLANAKFLIDRTRWNIRYGSGSFFSNLGNKAIDNNIEFGLHIVSEGFQSQKKSKS